MESDTRLWFAVGSYFLVGWGSNKSFTMVECYTFPHLFSGCSLWNHLPHMPLNWIRLFLRSLLLTLCNSIAFPRYLLIVLSLIRIVLVCFSFVHSFTPLSSMQFIGFTRPFYSMDRCFMLCSTWWRWFLWDPSLRESWDLSACFTSQYCWQRPMPCCIFL